MIIVYIICAILYLIMISGVISLYYTYRKDIEELENRLLQLEKRETVTSRYVKDLGDDFLEHKCSCGGDKTMACKGKRKR